MTSTFGAYDAYEFVAEFYDEVYEKIRNKDIDFFVQYSRLAAGRTLELGCGTGRVLLPTAISGWDITGLDLSPYMLAKCQAKLNEQPKNVQTRVRLIQGNMTSFVTREQYSLVTVPFRAFQHLISVEQQQSCLGCIRRHLTSSGLLILDLFNPFPPRLVDDPKYRAEGEDFPETRLRDGKTLRRTSRTTAFHRNLQYNEIEIIYYVSHPDGRTERLVQAFPMRYFFRYEIEHLLNLCGFIVVDLFGDFDKSAFSDSSPEMIFVAKKR
ncbi:MAG: class I SAM-dependent methyltransferase [Candidatus Hermodarchaeia archaeon]|jgi:SAM-dependent methyltransferase